MNKEEKKIYNKTYQLANKERISKNKKEYNEKNKESISKQTSEYKKKNKKRILKQNQEYYKANRDKIANKQNVYRKNRYKTDIKYKITTTLRNRVYDALKNNSKSESTMFLIGCSVEYLMFHIQKQFTKGMSWDNHGTGYNGKGMEEWHIDHVRPCSKFDLSKPEEQRKCFHYTNLQPLWAEDNKKKGYK